MVNEKISTIATGGVGSLLVASTDVVATATFPSPDEISTLGQLLIQLAIGIATIWRIIKKPKDK